MVWLGTIAGSEAEETGEMGIERAICYSCDRDSATGMVVGGMSKGRWGSRERRRNLSRGDGRAHRRPPAP